MSKNKKENAIDLTIERKKERVRIMQTERKNAEDFALKSLEVHRKHREACSILGELIDQEIADIKWLKENQTVRKYRETETGGSEKAEND